jgi:hypothetical protein
LINVANPRVKCPTLAVLWRCWVALTHATLAIAAILADDDNHGRR